MPVHRPHDCAPLFALRAAFLLSEARAAPKQVLSEARYQQLGERRTKQHFFRQVQEDLQHAQTSNAHHTLLVQVRAITALMSGDTALASKQFDALLSRAPYHPVALMGPHVCSCARANLSRHCTPISRHCV